MANDFEVGPVAEEIIAGLKEALESSFVILFDEDEQMRHVSLSRKAWSSRKGWLKVPKNRCHVEAAINDRWRLVVWALTQTPLHPDAGALVAWAAKKLSHRLPRGRADDLPYPPTGGSGGPSGSAEIGIPVWWARRTRS